MIWRRMALLSVSPVIAVAGLHTSFDICLFPSGCETAAETRLEAHYLIDRSSINFVNSDSGSYGVYRAWLEVLQGDSVVYANGWERYDFLQEGEDVTTTQKVPDLEKVCLPEADYLVRATVQDVNSGETAQETWNLTLTQATPGHAIVSDLVLMARAPQPVSSDAFFHRYGQLIVPYADAIYSADIPTLHCFLELYNPEPEAIALELQVLGQDRQQLFAADTLFALPESGYNGLSSVVEVNRLPSGSYYLQLAALHGSQPQQLSAAGNQCKFFVYNPAVTELPAEYLAYRSRSTWNEIDSLELVEVFRKMRPLLTPQERRRYRQLNLAGQRNFIGEFWQQRDPTPGTAINEYRQRFLARLDYVSLQFRTSLLEGWETDRGEVYLKYGEPDSREQHDFSDSADLSHNPDIMGSSDDDGRSDSFSRPLSGGYVAWYYHALEGGVYFVFVDRQGLGDYMLVHSTKSGEIQNYNWQQQL